MKHSVIIPVFNGAYFIDACVKNVLVQLNQNDELIIVDDASTDETNFLLSSLSDPRIKLHRRSRNGGAAAARNDALRLSSGDYIHFLDHDDLWPLGRHAFIAKCIAIYDFDILSGHVSHFRCNSLSNIEAERYLLPAIQSAALPGSVVLARRVAQEIGEFNEEYSSGEFVDYISRALLLNLNWLKVDRILLNRRIHGNNHGLNNNMAPDYLKIVHNHLKRKRKFL